MSEHPINVSNQRISKSTTQPDVTVVIPNYNGSKYLSQTIDSVLNQEGVRTEVIVIDDGSTDDSREILESYGDRIQTFYQEHKGAPAARNLGWKNARAEYIKFLDADDVLLEGVLQQQFKQIRELNDHQIPYGQAQWTNEYLKPITGYPVMPIELSSDSAFQILTRNPLTSSPLHRKVCLQKVGGFNESFVKGQEFDLHLRLVLAGVHFIYFNNPSHVYYFRQALNNRISATSLKNNHKEIYSMFIHQQNLIEEAGLLSNQVKQALAIRLWNYGRGILRENGNTEAEKFFVAAKKLNKNVSKNGLYGLVNQLIGPYRSEELLDRLREIRSKVLS